jgi:hypothetical protein
MKKTIYILLAALFASIFTGCLDDFEDTNKNPNKMYETNIQLILPGSVYKTMNYFAEMNFNRYLNYSRYNIVSAFNDPSAYEGAFNNYYINVLKDLAAVEKEYEGMEGGENRLRMAKTWKALVYSIMVATWGPIPMSDAMMTYPDKKYFKYDNELDIYIQLLGDLKEASEGFDTNPVTNDYLTNDPVFGGGAKTNIEKWRKFAHTLRLDLALRIQNADKALAEQHVKECMEHEEWLISSLDEMVQPSWGTDLNLDVSWYYNRILKSLTEANFNANTYPRIGQYMFTYLQSYKDPRLEKYVEPTKPADRYAVEDTISIIRKSVYSGLDTTMIALVKHSIPHCPAPETPREPATWEVAYNPGSNNGQGTLKYQYPYRDMSLWGWALIHKDFIKEDAKVVFLSWASACFMKAEAKQEFGFGSKSAKEYYEEGIKASFMQYGVDGQLSGYMERDGIKWGTSGTGLPDYMMIWNADIAGNPMEQIIKQRWIAEYFNGFAGWVLERRTRILDLPPHFYAGSGGLEGSNNRFDFSPERFNYPENERNTNKTEYDKGIQLLQQNSPKGDPSSRWGDNLWTHLMYAKVNPALPAAEAKWTNRTFIWNQINIQNYYGKTEEDLIKNAQKEFVAIQDTTGLKEYLKYEIVRIVTPLE